jgi:predicted RNA-binding protein with EMAP domain
MKKSIPKKLTPIGQLRAARKELKKYLSMCKEEDILGGIRNLAQCYLSWKDIAEERKKQIDTLDQRVEWLEDEIDWMKDEPQ